MAGIACPCMRCSFTLLLFRSAESTSTPETRALGSVPKAPPTSPIPDLHPSKTNSHDQYTAALCLSEPVSLETVSGDNPLRAPFHTDTELVATIPTTIAAYAVVASDGNTVGDAAGHTAAISGSAAPTAAYKNEPHCSAQNCPPFQKACKSKAFAAMPALLESTAQGGAPFAANDIDSVQRQEGESSAQQQRVAAMQVPDKQSCKAKIPSRDIFVETESCRHRQASKAASRVLVTQQQQLLWAAMSKGGGEGSVPSWINAAVGYYE